MDALRLYGPRISVVVVLGVGCSGSGDGIAVGTEGGPCYGNGTCNAGLMCTPTTQTCVQPGTISDFDADGGNDVAWSWDVPSGDVAVVTDPAVADGDLLIPGDEENVSLDVDGVVGDEGTFDDTIVDVADFEAQEPGPDDASVVLDAEATDPSSEPGKCKPVLIPAVINFGYILSGSTKTMEVKVHNQGTGHCSFHNARIADCASSPIGGTCSDPFKLAASKTFLIPAGGMPPAVLNGIGPGMDVPITVEFQAAGTATSAYGLLAAKILDMNTESGTPKEIQVPPATTTQPNLTGASGPIRMSVVPGEVDFGTVTIGCYSKTFKICVYNTGYTPLTVSGIQLDGACSKEFKLKNVPSLPQTFPANGSVCFETAYAPIDAGGDECPVEVVNNDPAGNLVAVPMKGNGTLAAEQSDEYVQASGQAVDILFVIDDSSSMCVQQDKLIAAYGDFISKIEAAKSDFHIGLIDSNVLDPVMMGKLNRGNPNPPARFLTPTTTDGKNKFKDMADMGCDGTAPWAKGGMDNITDAQEAGLEASVMALSAPQTTETGVTCATNMDCQGNPTLCPSPSSCPFFCIEGTCGGWNKGFLRDDAQLEIIHLSDEEDQSPATVGYYIDFFKYSKGFNNTGMVHVHSIVAQPSSWCGEPGKRYIEASQQTNGRVGNICDTNYSTVMGEIGSMAFGAKMQFPLTRLADPTTVAVSVAGQVCLTGWTYDEMSNSVVFDNSKPADPCSQPQPGQSIAIQYDTLCLQS